MAVPNSTDGSIEAGYAARQTIRGSAFYPFHDVILSDSDTTLMSGRYGVFKLAAAGASFVGSLQGEVNLTLSDAHAMPQENCSGPTSQHINQSAPKLIQLAWWGEGIGHGRGSYSVCAFPFSGGLTDCPDAAQPCTTRQGASYAATVEFPGNQNTALAYTFTAKCT